MRRLLILKAAGLWLLILGLAFCNAALREIMLIPLLGGVIAFTLSGATLAAVILLVAYASVPWMRARSTRELLATGLGWSALTVAFDLGLGWIQGKPSHLLFEAYLFKGGKLWPIVLLVSLSASYVAAKLRRRG